MRIARTYSYRHVRMITPAEATGSRYDNTIPEWSVLAMSRRSDRTKSTNSVTSADSSHVLYESEASGE